MVAEIPGGRTPHFLKYSEVALEVSGESPAITWSIRHISENSGLAFCFEFQQDLIRSASFCGHSGGIGGLAPLQTCSGMVNIESSS